MSLYTLEQIQMHPIYEDNKILFNDFIEKAVNKYSSLKLLSAFLHFIDIKTSSKKKYTRINYNIRVTFFCLLDLFKLCGFSKKILKLPNNIIRLLNSIRSGHRLYMSCTIIIPEQNIFSCDCGCNITALYRNTCNLNYCPYQSGIITKFSSRDTSYDYMAFKSRYAVFKFYEHYIINKILCINYDQIIFVGQPIGNAIIYQKKTNIYRRMYINKYRNICDIFLLCELCNLIFAYYY